MNTSRKSFVWIIAGLFSFFLLANIATAAKKTPVDHWKDAGISWDDAKKEMFFVRWVAESASGEKALEKVGCNLTSAHRLACMLGLSEAAGFAQSQKLEIWPKSMTPQAGASLLAEFEKTNLYVVDFEKMGLTDPKKINDWNKSFVKNWKDYILSTPAENGELLDLEKILVWIESHKKENADSVEMAMISMRSYMGTVFHDHSGMLSRGEYNDMIDSAALSLIGIGAEVFLTPDKYTGISNPIEGGPASQAKPLNPGIEQVGLQPQDVIVEIDNQSIKGQSLQESVDMLLGEEDTTVRLKVKRPGVDEEIEFAIVRKRITLERVTSKILEVETKQNDNFSVGYIKYRSFKAEQDCRKIENTVKNFEGQGVDAYTLDLSTNPGGLIQIPACIADIFLPPGLLVTETRSIDGTGNLSRLYTVKPQVTEKPLTLVMASGSASASELLAGALVDYGRALVVGTNSFGKGTVQTVRPASAFIRQGFMIFDLEGNPTKIKSLPFSQHKGMLAKLTTARFHQPSGKSNQLRGIKPHYTAYKRKSKPSDETVIRREENIAKRPVPIFGEDPAYEALPEVDRCLGEELVNTADQDFGAVDTPESSDYPVLKARDVAVCLALTETQLNVRVSEEKQQAYMALFEGAYERLRNGHFTSVQNRQKRENDPWTIDFNTTILRQLGLPVPRID